MTGDPLLQSLLKVQRAAHALRKEMGGLPAAYDVLDGAITTYADRRQAPAREAQDAVLHRLTTKEAIPSPHRLADQVHHLRPREATRSHLRDALGTFTTIEAQLEVSRTRIELATLAASGGDLRSALAHVEAAEALLGDLDAPVHLERAQQMAIELRRAG